MNIPALYTPSTLVPMHITAASGWSPATVERLLPTDPGSATLTPY